MLTPSLAAAWFTYDTTVPHSLHSYFTLKCLHSYLSRALFLHLIHWRLKAHDLHWEGHLDTFNIYTLNISYLLVLLLPSFLYKKYHNSFKSKSFSCEFDHVHGWKCNFFYHEYGCATRSAFESTFWIYWCENKHSGNEFWQMMNSKLWFYIITVDSR